MANDRFEFASFKARAGLGRPGLNYLKFLLPIIVILGASTYLLTRHVRFQGPIEVPVFSTEGSKGRFVEQFLKNEIDGPYDLKPLRDMCASKQRKYQPGLVIQCNPPIGGFGNIKNMMLNCLRFSLEAGATGFVLPVITIRNTDDITDLSNHGLTVGFNYLFDLQHFIRAFTSACPQIHLYLTRDSLRDTQTNIHGIDSPPESQLTPEELPDMRFHPMAESVIANMETWRPKFDQWMRETQPPFSLDNPIVITIRSESLPLLRFPINYDPPAFIATYGRLLQTRWDIRRIAAAVLYSLSERDNLDLDFTRPGIQEGKFYGVHLRTDKDAMNVNWPGYDMQSKNYLEGGKKSGLKSMYLASGSPEDSARFRAEAEKEGIIGAMKSDLLARPGFEIENERMTNLTWDQQGVIDYEVLLRSSAFSGVFESSYSWAISNRRHVVLHKGTWEMIYEGHTGAEAEGPETFIDKYSTIYGPKDMLRLRWQFPLGLWP